MEEYDFLIDLMTWSFSRINSFHHCPMEWKWRYIDCNYGGENAMSQFGTFCHQILESYAKGDLDIFELAQVYEDGYSDAVNLPFPTNQFVDIGEQYYEKGLEYFSNIDLDLDNYDILGVEKKVTFKIGNYDIIGFIDLLLRDKENGDIIILDHKSASIKTLKNGKISKKDQKHFEEFKNQLYLYSIPIIEQYGKVDYLMWNLFKERNYIKIPYDHNELEKAKQWALDTIHEIENEKNYDPVFDYFYCTNLCGLNKKEFCPYRYLGTIYATFKSKCNSIKNRDYEDYGAKGIKFCDEWNNDINTFFKWSMENGFEYGAKLRRFDENGDFSPDNCYFDFTNQDSEME